MFVFVGINRKDLDNDWTPWGFMPVFLVWSSTWLAIWLQWRHNGRHGVANHQQLDGLFNYLFWLTSKKQQSSALLATCEGNSSMTCEFPAQRPVTRKSFDLMTSSWSYFVVLYIDTFDGTSTLLPDEAKPLTGPMLTPNLCRHMTSLGHNEFTVKDSLMMRSLMGMSPFIFNIFCNPRQLFVKINEYYCIETCN